MKLFRSLIAITLLFTLGSAAMATTVTLNMTTGLGTTAAVPWDQAGKGENRVAIPVNFTAYGAAGTTVTATSEVTVWNIPAGAIVTGVGMNVTTAQGATCTADVGWSGAATAAGSNVNLNATGYKFTPVAIASVAVKTTATPLIITADHTISNVIGVVYVFYRTLY